MLCLFKGLLWLFVLSDTLLSNGNEGPLGLPYMANWDGWKWNNKEERIFKSEMYYRCL